MRIRFEFTVATLNTQKTTTIGGSKKNVFVLRYDGLHSAQRTLRETR
jgi:hypothetical protein